MNEKIQRWDTTYAAVRDFPEPNPDLIRYRDLLPKHGLALEVACGLGADALYLASQGFDVTAWDASTIAIGRLQQEAAARSLCLTTSCLEITPKAFTSAQFDLVYVHRYLDRDIIPAILKSLKPSGVLFYQTFSQSATGSVTPTTGPTNKAYRLAANELLTHCGALNIKLFIEGFASNAETSRLEPHAQALIIATNPVPQNLL